MAQLQPHHGPGPQVLGASTITGDEVRNPEGEDLGKIEEIMLDMGSGRISYAVLSFGGMLGMGDKLFAIPWNSLQLDPENKYFVLDVDKERLKNAPGFDKNNWPAMADNTWATQIHSYYGSRPYWDI
jgi:sporulation protein YlmC with PRC-barrel domain